LPGTHDERAGSPALHGVGGDAAELVTIPESELASHVAIEGAIRSGKTVLLRDAVTVAIHKTNGPVIVIDPKGGGDLVGTAIVEAHLAKRPLWIICPVFPELSARFDPFSTCQSAIEIKERVRALMPVSREPIFTEKPLAALQRAAELMQRLGESWNIKRLHASALRWPDRVRLAAAYLRHLGGDIPDTPPPQYPQVSRLRSAYDMLGETDELFDQVISDLEHRREWYEQMTNNLDAALSGIVDTSYTDMLTKRPALTWEQIDQQRAVVVVVTASLMLGQAANRLCRLFLQDCMCYIGQRYILSPRAAPNPITIVCDEFSEVVYEDFVRQVNKGGEAGARYILAWQSLADLTTALGRDRARELLDNLQSRVTLRLADPETAEALSRGYGTCEIHKVSRGAMREVGRAEQGGSRASQTQSHEEVPVIDPQWWAQLPKGEGFVRTKGSLYKVLIPLPPPPDGRVIERLGYSKLIRSLRQKALEEEVCGS
jgi:hypothetical protein